MAKVNVRLKNRNVNVRAFGFDFNEEGVCNDDKEAFESLIAAKKVFLVKDLKAHTDEIKLLAGVDEDEDES